MTVLPILLAVDGSEAALQACRLVASWRSDRLELQVTLLTVQRPPVRMSLQSAVPHGVLEEALLAEGMRELAPAQALLAAAGVQARAVVRVGSPAETILACAQEIGCGVLVMGSGRQGAVGGYAVGSVALRIAPAAPCTVLLVPPEARLPAEPVARLRVTLAVDGSPEAQRAAQRLAACAAVVGELHVDLVNAQPGLTLAEAMLPPHDDVVRQWGGQEAASALAQAQQVLRAGGVPHASHQLTGEPGTAIAAFADTHGADLIAMGSRGLGTMHHLLLGSVALATARRARVPVAIVR